MSKKKPPGVQRFLKDLSVYQGVRRILSTAKARENQK